jgi:integrase
LNQIAIDRTAPLTFKLAAERWWKEHGSLLSDPRALAPLNRLIEIIGAKTMLADIDDNVISHMIAERRKDVRYDSTDDKGKRLSRPITASTVNRTTALLRRILNRARDNWNVSLPKLPRSWKRHWLKEAKRHVRELTPAEERALDEVECVDYAEIRRFAIVTGLRRRDILLRWSQVDFELGVVRVITKGGTPRVIPLTREAYAMLWRRRGHHPEWVFTFQAARTCNYKTGQRILGQRYPITYAGLGSNKRKWAKAGVSARIHDLRHTTGMRTLRETGNLRVVQKLLGHTDISVTSKFYTDALVEDLRQAMEATSSARAEMEPLPNEKSETKKK